MKKLLFIILYFLIIQVSHSQVPFHRGVNLTGWFQADNARKIQFRKFTKKDFADIKSLGCDVIRLPINMHGMTSGAPNFTIDPLLFSLLDSAVSWAEELQIYLLIDNHSFDPIANTSPDINLTLNKIWPQVAEHYRDRSSYIMYEVLNEPHGISNQLWGNIQQQAINAIRSKDTKHTIIVGPSGYNSYNDLAQMPVYTDPNLIYTFHFYDPFMFTHQGASWVEPSMVPLSGVPFPYNAATMPACPTSLLGSWIESGLKSYPVDGTVAKVKSLIDIAVNFKNARNVNLFCGEFGVYMPNSNTVDRSFWYKTVKDYLDLKGIPWTIWDYKGSFGLFKKGSGEVFESDLNVPLLEALNFTVPEQHSYSPRPDSVGFKIYDDYLEQGINEASYTTGTIDFYSTLIPNNDHYCLYWSGGARYTAIALVFAPQRDFSKLVNSGFALDMMVRGNGSGIKFDIRFLDTKTSDPADHPWRKIATLNDQTPGWDKKWHHIHIPLSNFTEQGSWDNNTWYNPAGKFDWSAIDRLEIVAEYASNEGKEIWFDNIMITDQDTATVLEKGTLGINTQRASDYTPGLQFVPNPMTSSATFTYLIPEKGPVKISIYDINGQKVSDLVNEILPKGNYSFRFNGKDDQGKTLPDGMYICRLTAGKFQQSGKLIIRAD
jgi:endoglucanase